MSARPDFAKLANCLKDWGLLGQRILAVQAPGKVDWSPAQAMILAANDLWQLRRKQLDDMLAESSRRLHPLADPLHEDFGAHRWLGDDREESYSDWLAWIVQKLGTADRVLQLFDIHDPSAVGACEGVPLLVDREVPVPEGYEGQSGRTDLVIRYPERLLILVEVKLGSADVAETEKHRGYLKWHKEQKEIQKRGPLLLATEGSRHAYHGFRLVRWRQVGLNLRRIVLEAQLGPVSAAMMLAFCGAVEQNLLGWSRRSPWPTAETTEYLSELLGQEASMERESEAKRRFLEEGTRSYLEAKVAVDHFERDLQGYCRKLVTRHLPELARATQLNKEIGEAQDHSYDGKDWAVLGVKIRLEEFGWLYFYLWWHYDDERAPRLDIVGSVEPHKGGKEVLERFRKKGAIGLLYDGEVYKPTPLRDGSLDNLEEALAQQVEFWIELWRKVGGVPAFRDLK